MNCKQIWEAMFSFIVETICLDKSGPFSVPGPLMSRQEIVTYAMSLSTHRPYA